MFAVVSNALALVFEVTGETASARVQTQEVLKFKDGSTRLVGGLYTDTLVKRDTRWLYSSRSFRIVAEYHPKGD